MGRPNHHVNLHAPRCGPDDAFDDNEVLVSFILNKKRMPCLINESCDTVTTVYAAPNEARIFAWIKIRSFPVSFETHDHLCDFMRVSSDNCIVAGFCKIFCFPVK